MFNEIRRLIGAYEKDNGDYNKGQYIYSIQVERNYEGKFSAEVHMQAKRFFEYISSNEVDFKMWYETSAESNAVHLCAKERDVQPEVALRTVLFREDILRYVDGYIDYDVYKKLVNMDTERMFMECVKLGLFGGALKDGLL